MISLLQMEKYYLAALQMAGGIGCAQLGRLLLAFGTAEAVWRAAAAELEQGGLEHTLAVQLAAFCRQDEARPQRIAESCQKQKVSLCTLRDPEYPILLKQIYTAPQVLFYRGCLQADCSRLAMVGSRMASNYGKGVAEQLAAELASHDITIVSGAARGIDTAAHLGALQKGRTAAVLGCGIDVVYPPDNAELLAAIAESGVVLSEYAPGTPPLPVFFPARNRIISGLASGTIVVEAAEKSGSLITAEFVLSEGRDVFAVPGSIYSGTSRGCHRLIQQGAKLVTGSADILEEYGAASGKKGAARRNVQELPEMSAEEAAIYQILSWERPLSMDEVIYKLHGNTSNTAFLLLQMELRGLVTENESHAYTRSAVKEGIL